MSRPHWRLSFLKFFELRLKGLVYTDASVDLLTLTSGILGKIVEKAHSRVVGGVTLSPRRFTLKRYEGVVG